jgi:H+-translocating diphosphatase
MGSDLFGSFAESTCAALIVSGTSIELTTDFLFLYPLLISAAGILVCIITSFFALFVMKVTEKEKIERTLFWQLLISSILLTPTIIIITNNILPETFVFNSPDESKPNNVVTRFGANVCFLCGLWAGLIIGMVTDYYTSNKHNPTSKLANDCKSGSAINIIQGLALGYSSVIIPILSIAGHNKFLPSLYLLRILFLRNVWISFICLRNAL